MEPLPPVDPDHADGWVDRHLDGLFSGEATRSRSFVGGQAAADAALDALDISGYAKRRSIVEPAAARGASRLSPYIRYSLIDLPSVHDHPSVAGADSYDRFRFRGELLWQEYSRHWYAAFGRGTRSGVVYEPTPGRSAETWTRPPWPDDMACVRTNLDELHADGWMVNQTRMWMASQWSVRAGADWRDGDDEMFRHLLDGSRAANRQGWQWVVGGLRNRSYGFARRQVEKRAPDLCDRCELRDACPIGGYPGSVAGEMVEPAPTMTMDLFGPVDSAPTLFDRPDDMPSPGDGPDAVWITAESLGDADPAMSRHPGLPVHFVFDEPLLRRLRLDGKRLVFLADCLADLGRRRDLHVWRGRPVDLLDGAHDTIGGARFVTTRAPVPGFASIVGRASTPPDMESWRWLRPPSTRLAERLDAKRFPSFKDWCRITKPGAT